MFQVLPKNLTRLQTLSRYKHVDMADLERQLQETQSARVRLIATDGVFSMDGHVAPLDEIVALARKYDAVTFVDDCHATGFLGATGRGTDEYCGVQGQVGYEISQSSEL